MIELVGGGGRHPGNRVVIRPERDREITRYPTEARVAPVHRRHRVVRVQQEHAHIHRVRTFQIDAPRRERRIRPFESSTNRVRNSRPLDAVKGGTDCCWVAFRHELPLPRRGEKRIVTRRGPIGLGRQHRREHAPERPHDLPQDDAVPLLRRYVEVVPHCAHRIVHTKCRHSSSAPLSSGGHLRKCGLLPVSPYRRSPTERGSSRTRPCRAIRFRRRS